MPRRFKWPRPRPPSRLEWALIILAIGVCVRMLGYAFFPGVDVFATLPISEDHTRHSCFSAYFLGVKLAALHQPLYAEGIYTDALGALHGVPLDAVNIDAFVYPPLFLPILEPLVALDFAVGRGLWMMLNLGVLIGALWATTRAVGGVNGTLLARWIPAVLLTLSVQSQIQFGNAHLLVMATALWGMVRIEQGHERSGAALLAWSIGAKLFPGLLVVFLAARGRWRAIGYTALWGLGLGALTVALYGFGPVVEFFAVHVPRLASGEAFGWLFVKPESAAINISPFGIPIKLGFLGLLDEPKPVARVVGSLYLIAILALAWRAGRRLPGDHSTASRLARLQLAGLLLILGAMQTPFYDAFRGNAALFIGVWLLAPSLKKRWLFGLFYFEVAFLPLMVLMGPLWARAAMGVAGMLVAIDVGWLLYTRAMRFYRPDLTPQRT